MENSKIFGVTGGIGCGKSLVLEILSNLGYTTISCDDEIKRMYEDEDIIKKVSALFPSTLVNGKIDKKILSSIVFNDKSRLHELNNVLHPLVIERCFKYVRENNKGKSSFIEVPLLFESNLQDKFDNIIVVIRKLSDRIESVKIRSNLTEVEILDRIKNQINYDNYNFEKYIIVENNDTKEILKEKIIELLHKMV